MIRCTEHVTIHVIVSVEFAGITIAISYPQWLGARKLQIEFSTYFWLTRDLPGCVETRSLWSREESSGHCPRVDLAELPTASSSALSADEQA